MAAASTTIKISVDASPAKSAPKDLSSSVNGTPASLRSLRAARGGHQVPYNVFRESDGRAGQVPHMALMRLARFPDIRANIRANAGIRRVLPA